MQWDEATKRAGEAVIQAKSTVAEHGIDMSIASGEFDLEGTQFTGYFTANERVDFRGLVRDLSRDLNARVQLLQVGDRDRAKLTDGFDICGERLCCSSWMTNFPSVSIRMAKEQDLPLNPQKISGVCGRLYCCLTFEYDDYKALRGTLPKVGSMLSTPAGEAKVTGIDFNREMVKLWLTEQHMQVEVAAIDFQLQHGVTVRPMELVRRIEGELRPLFEDSSQTIIPSPPAAACPGRAPTPASRRRWSAAISATAARARGSSCTRGPLPVIAAAAGVEDVAKDGASMPVEARSRHGQRRRPAASAAAALRGACRRPAAQAATAPARTRRLRRPASGRPLERIAPQSSRVTTRAARFGGTSWPGSFFLSAACWISALPSV